MSFQFGLVSTLGLSYRVKIGPVFQEGLGAKLASQPRLPLYCETLFHRFLMNGFIITYQIIMNKVQASGMLCMGGSLE